MPDKLELLVAGQKLELFKSFAIASDIYSAANAFSIEVGQVGAVIPRGARCQLYINDSLELSGIVDKVEREYSKPEGRRVVVHGRDMMGLLIDASVESFGDLTELSLEGLAHRLLAKAPFVNIKAIRFGRGRKPAQTEDDVMRANPGETIFDVLKKFSAARGLLFYCLPNGNFVFDKPREKAKPQFNVVLRKDGAGNNVLRATHSEDMSKRFSKVIVIGQQQGGDADEADDFNIEATQTDRDFPFYKPHVAVIDHSAESASRFAKMLLERQRAESLTLEYTLPGFTQNGVNFAANVFCHVYDEEFGIDADYLIYGRTFNLDKKTGATTTLRLGPAGLLQ